ncbi:MAG: aldo/keto reductase, partial [Coriobacteriales bacterium]
MRYSDVCGEKVSMLGMGCMRLPVKKGSIIRSIDYVEGKRVIDYAMEHGINYFDTAYIYHLGKSETFLAKALQDYPRESYFLADKFHIMTNPSYKHVFKRQLKKLRTDYIDFYLAHGIMDFTYRSYIQSGCVEWLMEQKERGRIKHLGFSSHASPGSLRKFCEYADWDFVQLQINYMDWQFGTAREQYEIACEFGLPVIVMEPVKGGRLVSLGEQPDAMLKGRDPEHSIPSWAMRFLMGLPQVKV